MQASEIRTTLMLSLRCVVGLALAVGCGTANVTKVPSVDSDDRARKVSSESRFTDITNASGIDFTHDVEGDRRYFFPEIMASGVALLDYDQDGDLDVYLINAGVTPANLSTTDSDKPPTNRLFRQEPDGRFVDVTAGSGLDDPSFGMGVAVGDINNDGYPDIYVTNYGADRLFLNRRDGTFADITEDAGIDNVRWSASACFVDFDRDGWLDLFVTNYVDYVPFQPCYDARGWLDYCNPAMFPGTADKLYRNLSMPVTGEGSPSNTELDVKFEDVSLASGIAEKAGAGLGVVCSDFNSDGWADLYVANDGHANFAWINRRDGTFREEAVLLGVAYDGLGRGQGSMGIAAADVNNDSKLDLLVTHLEGESNALYLTTDQQGFQESSSRAGLSRDSFAWTGFGAAFVDFEHDGDLDLVVANGRVRRVAQASWHEDDARTRPADSFWAAYAEPNHLFSADPDGQFRRIDAAAFSGRNEISRGLACGDIDNDGDIDLLVTNVAGTCRLFRNDFPKRGHWISVRAVVTQWGGRDAYGAVITVHAAGRRWRQMVNPGSSYLSSHDPRVHFGVGSAGRVDRIEVLWPDGVREVFPGQSSDQFVLLTRGQGEPR